MNPKRFSTVLVLLLCLMALATWPGPRPRNAGR